MANSLLHASPSLGASGVWLFRFQRSRWRPFPQGSVSRGTLGENPEAALAKAATDPESLTDEELGIVAQWVWYWGVMTAALTC